MVSCVPASFVPNKWLRGGERISANTYIENLPTYNAFDVRIACFKTIQHYLNIYDYRLNSLIKYIDYNNKQHDTPSTRLHADTLTCF